MLCLQINGQSLAHVTPQVAVEAFRKATEKVVLVVEGGAEARIKVCRVCSTVCSVCKSGSCG